MSIKAYIVIVYTVICLAVGAYGGWRWERSVYLDLQVKVEKANTKAQTLARQRDEAFQHLSDAITQSYEADRSKREAEARAARSEVQKHVRTVKVDHNCITYGFVRVLDAASQRVSADSLPLPSGGSDDACSPLGTSDVAERLINNIATFNGNAAQLGALQDSLRQLEAKAKQLQPR